MRYINIFLYISMLTLFCPVNANAGTRARVTCPADKPLTWGCVRDAALRYNLPFAALVGVLAVEGGKVGEALDNKNRTWDLGPAQVNTCHLGELAEAGFSPDAILRDGCVNIHAAAWILRKEYDRTRNLWTAIGAYHSRTPHLHRAYKQRVQRHLRRFARTGRLPSLPY